MMLNVGNKVVYPNQGPCRIGAVVEKAFGGRPISFYTFVVVDDSGDVLFHLIRAESFHREKNGKWISQY